MKTWSKSKFFIIILISLWLVLFGVVPLLMLIVTSFLTQDPVEFFTLSFSLTSYQELINPRYIEIILRSVKFAGLTTLLCLIFGYPFAWFTGRLRKRFRTLVLILLMVPFWTNSLIRTYAIRMVLGQKGLVNTILLSTGLIDSPIRLLYTDLAVVLGLFYLMLPFMILPLYANVEKFDYRLVEAARDLGASTFTWFRRVVLPLTLPGIFAGCIMVFVPTMGLFYVAALLGGAKQLLIGNLIQQQFLNAHNWPLGAASSVVLIIMMALMLAGYGLILHRFTVRRYDK
ncbi:spermidine/putrescine ABC transporter permease PotB [Desulforhopalus sp. IMCC35007]|uniref:spermidine/putrescine ABC transporter permease PotB n=1 Tax=Desulforhopalus sp. IMCC35007 TaxID=2569543 RepID=UPI0010AE14FC|nr:spermidine/putrescine ABC transporter permease PotB [Desulforhopalus sp. IMCC35007]TKB07638.1 spermidine/putrescine ABC transporter permease PotB [Desulforhopalus sp. IMCC35007]